MYIQLIEPTHKLLFAAYADSILKLAPTFYAQSAVFDPRIAYSKGFFWERRSRQVEFLCKIGS
jgi:hypothetical protein